MPQPSPSPPHSAFGSLALIAVVVAAGAAALAYTAGWLSPNRLTPTKIRALAPTPVRLGTGEIMQRASASPAYSDQTGTARSSRAQVFSADGGPALGRFSLGTLILTHRMRRSSAG